MADKNHIEFLRDLISQKALVSKKVLLFTTYVGERGRVFG
jgi:hypothetical protein